MNETIKHIVAEMRRDCPARHMDGTMYREEDWVYTKGTARKLADRIEAAWKREVETTTDESSAVGNAAAMREALETISKCDTSKEEDCYTLYRVCEAALSALPRNCDIGTAEEQSERYEKFCYAHRSREKGCGGCPLCDIVCCGFAWLQMPYEEGGAK